MTDRELLEAAARAAGLKIDKSPYNGGGIGNTGFDVLGNAVLDWHNGKTWNPLADDGDALRLAVRLRISVQLAETPPDRPECGYSLPTESGCEWKYVNAHDSDPCAATRRAIVRAAAQIGSSMGEGNE